MELRVQLLLCFEASSSVRAIEGAAENQKSQGTGSYTRY
jgi:hypothetical protein